MRVLFIVGSSAVVLVFFLLATMFGAGIGGRAHDEAAERFTPAEWGEDDELDDIEHRCNVWDEGKR